MSRQLTLALLKPCIASAPHVVSAVQTAILESDLYILEKKRFEPGDESDRLVKKFYAEHEGKFFHRRCIEYMQSGPFEAWVLAGPDAIVKWRSLIGNAQVYKDSFNLVESLRVNHGVSDTRNGFHGSDSSDSSQAEMGLLNLSYIKHLDQLNNNFEFIPEFGLHKTVLDSGFCHDVSKTLGLQSTWDRIYSNLDTAPKEWFSTSRLNTTLFEWIEQLRASPNTKEPLKILDIGCGLSTLCNDVATTFSESVQVLAVDYSADLIKNRQKDVESVEDESVPVPANLKFQQVDLINDDLQGLDWGPENTGSRVDIVIDKATIDAIIRQPDGEEHGRAVMRKLVELRPRVMICVSDEGPEVRSDFLAKIMPSGVEYGIICENISEKYDEYNSSHYAQYFAYFLHFKY